MLALPNGDNEANKVFSSFTLHEDYRKIIEPAGKFFEEYAEMRLYSDDKKEKVNTELEDEDIIEEDKEEYEWEKEYKNNTKSHEVIFSGNDNFYAILGIEDLFLNATTDDIRRAYKKLALLYHPDKNKENKGHDNIKEDKSDDENMTQDETNILDLDTSKMTEEEKTKIEINKKWLKIKEAYETLLDEEKKKKYDSTFQFDDTIPDEDMVYSEKKFFSSFGPCFLKNSIWSKKKPIPKIGDMNTPLDKVKQFYRFWTNFQTWRDYSVEGEYNLEDASCRYEKRQMLKENQKMKKSQIKEEKARLIKLVNIAYKNDPRIIAEEEKLSAERERVRLERIQQKMKEKEEEEERLKKVKREYEENIKRQQENIVKEKENMINTIISLAAELGITLSSDDKFQIMLNGKTETIKTILNEVYSKEDKKEKNQLYKSMTKSYYSLKFVDDVAKPVESMIWNKEEIHGLQKGVRKFPVGTKDRWEKVNELVKTKSVTQIIQMTHYLTTNPTIKIDGDIDLSQILAKKSDKKIEPPKAAPVVVDEEAWSELQQKALEGALKKFSASLSANDRWTKIANEIPGKNKKQCVDRYKHLSSLIKKK